tara:strand:+ start:122 stop:553 length:432 start_codon:yes stop_codon:yes gene_type:complete
MEPEITARQTSTHVPASPSVAAENEALSSWVHAKFLSNLKAVEMQSSGKTSSGLYFPTSLEVYAPHAMASYDCYKEYARFWTQRAPEKLPGIVQLESVIAILRKNEIYCAGVAGVSPVKPPDLLTLEELRVLRDGKEPKLDEA